MVIGDDWLLVHINKARTALENRWRGIPLDTSMVGMVPVDRNFERIILMAANIMTNCTEWEIGVLDYVKSVLPKISDNTLRNLWYAARIKTADARDFGTGESIKMWRSFRRAVEKEQRRRKHENSC